MIKITWVETQFSCITVYTWVKFRMLADFFGNDKFFTNMTIDFSIDLSIFIYWLNIKICWQNINPVFRLFKAIPISTIR